MPLCFENFPNKWFSHVGNYFTFLITIDLMLDLKIPGISHL